MMIDTMTLIWAALIGYGLGAIPFGYIFARLGGHGDIRDIGSGNIGSSNVLRTGSKMLAFFTLLADMGKAAAATALVWHLFGESYVLISGVAALIGHVFPIWLGFKGGKGVAVYLGMMLYVSPLTGILAIVLWLLVALIFRMSSLAALVAIAISLPFLWLLGEQMTAYAGALMALLVFWAHRANIGRMRDGSEPNIGARG